MDPTVERYIEELQSKRQDVEDRLRNREDKRRESNELFVTSVKKELELLEKKKMTYELRNTKFIEETKSIVEDYKAELAKAYQADQALVHYKRKLDKFVQKNYPKIVSQLKARLFHDYDDTHKRNRMMRETGDIVTLNKEIRNLNDEIQSKRFELIEEEERRLRNDGAYKSYMYTTSAYPKGYDSAYARGGSVRNDISRSKIDHSNSPLREDVRGSHLTGNEDIRISGVISRDGDVRRGSLDKNKTTPPKVVKFDDPHRQRDASPEFSKPAGGTSNINTFGAGSSLRSQPQTQIQSQLQVPSQTRAEPAVVIKDLGTQNKASGGVQKLNLGKIGKPEPAVTATTTQQATVNRQPATRQADVFKTDDDLGFEDLDDF